MTRYKLKNNIIIMTRKITQYKINNEIIFEDPDDVLLDAVERMKGYIADAHGITPNDIEVVVIDSEIELSGIDVTNDGMFNWLDTQYRIYTGVTFDLIYGSDEHLDAINNGTVENYLKFN